MVTKNIWEATVTPPSAPQSKISIKIKTVVEIVLQLLQIASTLNKLLH